MTGQNLGAPSQQAVATMKRATNQTAVPAATFTPITFDTVVEDNRGDQANLAGNPTRLTCRVAGFYIIRASAAFALAGGNGRVVYIRINGATYYGSEGIPGSSTVIVKFPTIDFVRLAVGDYAEAIVYQDTGGVMDLIAGEDALGLGWARVAD